MEGATALGYVPTTEFPGQFNHIMGGYPSWLLRLYVV